MNLYIENWIDKKNFNMAFKLFFKVKNNSISKKCITY